jgi:hypothetical protein
VWLRPGEDRIPLAGDQALQKFALNRINPIQEAVHFEVAHLIPPCDEFDELRARLGTIIRISMVSFAQCSHWICADGSMIANHDDLGE